MAIAQTTSNKNHDEQYTQESTVKELLPFVPKTIKDIGCPFDGKNSAFFKVLKKKYNVITTHIDTINHDPHYYKDFIQIPFKNSVVAKMSQIIISNPPGSIKRKILELCLTEYQLPFMLLLPNFLYDTIYFLEMVEKYNLQIIHPKYRINYCSKDGRVYTSGIPFGSMWVTGKCHLKQQLNFVSKYNPNKKLF